MVAISRRMPASGEPVLHAFGRRRHGLAHVDRSELEIDRAFVDGGEVEDVGDDGEERRRGARDMAGVIELALVKRADRLVAQELAEADDVGERRSSS